MRERGLRQLAWEKGEWTSLCPFIQYNKLKQLSSENVNTLLKSND